MNITVTRHDGVPVLTLSGRFDGYGATVFDQHVEPLTHEATSWVLDLGSVDYISSMGLRSLLRAEKRLRAQHGGVVLVGLTPPIRQVLDMVGLLGHFRVAESVERAVALVGVGSVAPDRALQRIRENRACTFWPLGGSSVLETWGSHTGTASQGGEGLQTFSLEDVGFAFGIAGLGATRAQASEAAGPFLSTPTFAGVLPADGHGVADFLLPEKPAEASIHVTSALGVEGTPSFALKIDCAAGFTARDLTQDVFALAAEAGGPDPGVFAILAVVRLADADRSGMLIGVAADS